MKCVTGARVFPHAVQACPQVCPGADTPHLGPLEDQGGRLWLSGAPPGTPVCRPSAVICYVCQSLSARGREESCQSCACAHTRPFVLEPRVPSAAARSAREPPPWRAGLPRAPPPAPRGFADAARSLRPHLRNGTWVSQSFGPSGYVFPPTLSQPQDPAVLRFTLVQGDT